jgi:superfamily II DNA or RNA helicase
MSYYKNYTNVDFNDIINKYEFSKNKTRDYIYQEPNQLLLRNIMNPYTIYDNLLLFQNVGLGKTCTSITIAEGFKEYLSQVNRKVFVLVKNDTIIKNFYNELLSKCTADTYLNDDEREYINNINIDPDNEDLLELKSRVKKSINKHYQFSTYGKFTNQVLGLTVKKSLLQQIGVEQANDVKRTVRKETELKNLDNTVIIVDEVHNILGNNTYKALLQLLQQSKNYKLILLTATPLYDSVESIIYINNLLNANNETLQLSKDILQDKIIDKTGIFKMGIQSISDFGLIEIRKNLLGKISYLRSNTETNPQIRDMGIGLNDLQGSVKIIHCQMSEYQYNVYKKTIMNELGLNDNAVIAMEEADTISSLYKASSDASTMVYPNDIYGKKGFYQYIESEKGDTIPDYKNILGINNIEVFSSKLYNIINNILNGTNGNIFIYSNFVTAGGTNLLKYLLLANDFKRYNNNSIHNGKNFIVMDDSVKPNLREYLLKLYNSYENRNGDIIRVIIGSPVLSEAITLKCIKQLHILEPFWNMSKINQVIGRGVRNYSHASLPESERFIEIYKYASVYTDTNLFYIDKEKYKVSEAKDRSNKVVERILKEISIDCSFNNTRNIITDSSANFTDKCDYTQCAYKCVIHSDNNVVDKSTYYAYIRFFEKYDIDYIKYAIRYLYKEYYMYTLDNIFVYLDTKIGHGLINLETVLVVLQDFVTNKIVLTDIHSREGFLIKRGIYYIFNAFDKNVDNSLFQNTFDFNVQQNFISLNDYALDDLHYDLEDETVSIVTTTIDDITNEFIEYNDNLIKSYDIIGSFRTRPKSNQQYGFSDDKFRLIDFGQGTVNKNEKTDRRYKVFGTVINTGYTKKDLQDIAKRLNITLQEKETKDSIGFLIRKFLIDNNRVLK